MALPPSRPLDLPREPDALYERLARGAEGKGSGLPAQMLEGNLFGHPAGAVIGHATYLVTAVVVELGERP